MALDEQRPYGTFGDEETPMYEKTPPPESNRGQLFRSLFCEFIGVALFIFLGSMSSTYGGQKDDKTGAGEVTGPALAHGIAIFVLISQMGHISGGHFNPAITFGIFLSGAQNWLHSILYVVSQLLGAILGAFFTRACLHGDDYTNIGGGTTTPTTDLPLEAITCELIFTYLLVSTVLLTAVDTDQNIFAPLAIGLSITVDIFAGGNVSGSSMNPARSFGPAVVYSIFGPASSDHWDLHYVYWIGPLLGGAAAAVIYRDPALSAGSLCSEQKPSFTSFFDENLDR